MNRSGHDGVDGERPAVAIDQSGMNTSGDPSEGLADLLLGDAVAVGQLDLVKCVRVADLFDEL